MRRADFVLELLNVSALKLSALDRTHVRYVPGFRRRQEKAAVWSSSLGAAVREGVNPHGAFAGGRTASAVHAFARALTNSSIYYP